MDHGQKPILTSFQLITMAILAYLLSFAVLSAVFLLLVHVKLKVYGPFEALERAFCAFFMLLAGLIGFAVAIF